MGRTNIVLDDRLVREGLRRFKCRSKHDAETCCHSEAR